MALGKICNTGHLKHRGLEIVLTAQVLGRKGVVVSNNMEASMSSSPFDTPSHKRLGGRWRSESPSRNVWLPEDIMIRILCKVNHADLKHLLLVSKFVNEMTLIARELHFAFSTPSSKPVFNGDCDLGDESSDEPPNAPKQHRVATTPIERRKFTSIAVALFASPEEQPVALFAPPEEQQPKNNSAVDM